MAAERTAFVMMPFASEFDDVYQSLIREPLISAGYQVFRGDDLLNQNNILEEIIGSIERSSLLIADLSTANPNVYYELGLAHAFQRPVVLFAQDIAEVPFDLRSYRIIQYSTHFAKMNAAIASFKSLLQGIEAGTVSFGSPVSDFGLLEPSRQRGPPSATAQSDLGLLDHRQALEEGAESITSIVGEVASRLNALTPQIAATTERLTSGQLSTKAQRTLMRALAQSIDGYVTWLSAANKRYGGAMDDISNALNAIFSSEIRIDAKERQALQTFVETLQKTEEQAARGRDQFAVLAHSVDSLPKIEKEFNRASRRLGTETREFIGNIDQTVSVFARARNAAKQLLGPENS